MTKKIEEEYLQKNSRYKIERELLSTMSKEDLKTMINDKSKEEWFHKGNLVQYMTKLINSESYSSFDELEKIFFEWLVYIKAWWKQLEDTRKIIKDLQYLYDLKYTNKKVFTKGNLSKEIIDKVKNLDIENVIVKFTNSTIRSNKSLKCPLHDDNRASFQIYTKTNSFYCYWCNVWWSPIEFTAKLFNLTNKEAINKLKTNFLFI